MGRDCSTPNTRFSFLLILEKHIKKVYLVYHVFGVKLEKLDNTKYTWNSRLPEYQCTIYPQPKNLQLFHGAKKVKGFSLGLH